MTNESASSQNWLQRNLRWIIPVVIAVIVVGGGLYGVLSWVNGVQNEGETKQNDIVQLQKNMVNDISKCLDTGAVQAQIVGQEYATMKDILVSVTAARYEGDNASLGQGGAMFSALTENYPQISQESWARLSGVIIGCRKDVGDAQEQLQGAITRFKTWSSTGGIFETRIRDDFPTDALTTTNALTSEKLKGEAALEYLGRLITVKDAQKAVQDGTMPDQQFFPTSPTK